MLPMVPQGVGQELTDVAPSDAPKGDCELSWPELWTKYGGKVAFQIKRMCHARALHAHRVAGAKWLHEARAKAWQQRVELQKAASSDARAWALQAASAGKEGGPTRSVQTTGHGPVVIDDQAAGPGWMTWAIIGVGAFALWRLIS